MNGTVLSGATNELLILGADGKRYRFAASDWKSGDSFREGQAVDFVADGEFAREIYAMEDHGGESPNPSREVMPLAVVTLVLAIAGVFVFPLAIGALICGHIAKKRFASPDNRQTGYGYVKAGLIIAYVWLAFVMAGWAVFALMLANA